jgi:hypothetical protein
VRSVTDVGGYSAIHDRDPAQVPAAEDLMKQSELALVMEKGQHPLAGDFHPVAHVETRQGSEPVYLGFW